MPSRIVAVVIALVTLGMPLVATADENPGDEDDYEAMLDLSNAAADAVADGQFAIGAVKFRQAYERYADPILLNNEMIAWYRGDDCNNALRPADRFLELERTEEIDPQDRENVRTVLVECHLRLAEQALQRDDLVLATYHLDTLSPIERDDEKQEQYDELRARLDQREPEDEADDVASAPAQTPTTTNHLGWGQIAGGIALAGIGLSMHTVALNRQSELRRLADDAETHDGAAALFEDRRSEWAGFQNTARWMVPTFYVLGAAAIGSGAYFLWQDPLGDDPVAVSPDVSLRRVGVSVSGRF